MLSSEEFKAALKAGMPVRDLVIIIADTIKGHRDSDNDLFESIIDSMKKLDLRILELEVHNQSMEERLRDYLETALVREDVANQRADRCEKRRLPHWTDMSR